MGQDLNITLPDMDWTTALLCTLSLLLAAAVAVLLRRPDDQELNDVRTRRERNSGPEYRPCLPPLVSSTGGGKRASTPTPAAPVATRVEELRHLVEDHQQQLLRAASTTQVRTIQLILGALQRELDEEENRPGGEEALPDPSTGGATFLEPRQGAGDADAVQGIADVASQVDNLAQLVSASTRTSRMKETRDVEKTFKAKTGLQLDFRALNAGAVLGFFRRDATIKVARNLWGVDAWEELNEKLRIPRLNDDHGLYFSQRDPMQSPFSSVTAEITPQMNAYTVAGFLLASGKGVPGVRLTSFKALSSLQLLEVHKNVVRDQDGKVSSKKLPEFVPGDVQFDTMLSWMLNAGRYYGAIFGERHERSIVAAIDKARDILNQYAELRLSTREVYWAFESSFDRTLTRCAQVASSALVGSGETHATVDYPKLEALIRRLPEYKGMDDIQFAAALPTLAEEFEEEFVQLIARLQRHANADLVASFLQKNNAPKGEESTIEEARRTVAEERNHDINKLLDARGAGGGSGGGGGGGGGGGLSSGSFWRQQEQQQRRERASDSEGTIDDS